MIRVVLADDEPLALQRLVRVLLDEPDVTVVGVAADGFSAQRQLRELAPDLVILDIEMPGCDGVAVAAALPAENRREIVFLTAFNRYGAEAFSVEAADYLLKPVQPERLRQALQRAGRRRAERAAGLPAGQAPALPPTEILHFPDRGGGRDVLQSDIVWIEADRDYALIYTASRSTMHRVTMAELSRKLHPSILRVHRSAFVSARAVQRRLRTERGLFSLLLHDGLKVQVGPSYARAVRASLKEFRPDLD